MSDPAYEALAGLCSKPGVAQTFLDLVEGRITPEEATRKLAPILVKGHKEGKDNKEEKED